ncbi:MAG: NAD(P)-dependent oxidoreductase [Pseudonocardiaceae bacterium]
MNRPECAHGEAGRALVTAELTDDGVGRLTALGYTVERGGWGATRRELTDYRSAAAGATLLVTEIERIDDTVLDACPDLRAVATARGAPSNVDIAACSARGVPVLHTPARNAESVADFTLGLILAITRGIARAERHLRRDGWLVNGELPYLHFRGPELAGRTLGLVGYGAVGRAVARRAARGFGMPVLFTDPAVPGGVGLDELLAASDVVSLHCPRSPATERLIRAETLERMPRGSYLVNTAGGACVDVDDLLRALDDGHLAGAALDVFGTEPLPPDDPLLRRDDVLLTPHLAGAACDVVRHHTAMICDDLEALHAGVAPRHCANPDVLS